MNSVRTEDMNRPRSLADRTARSGRLSISTHIASVLFLLVVACIAVAPGFWPGRMLGTTDILKTMAPWADGSDFRPVNEGLQDQPTQFSAWTKYAVERIRHAWATGQGSLAPLWNPHNGLGQPLAANGQSALFFPTFLLHLFLPATWSFTLSAVLRLWLAGVGMWLLAGRYGLRFWPRLLCGVSFMLCGYNIAWLNHPHTNVTACLPWAVLAVEMLIERVTLLGIAGGSAIIGLQFLGGHPASSMHLLLTCGMVYAGRVLGTDRKAPLRAAPALALVMGLGFALAALAWLPMLEYVNYSAASAWRQGRAQGTGLFAMQMEYALGMFYPYLNGYAPDGVTPFDIRLATRLPNTNELIAGWVGFIPLLLAFLAIGWLRRKSTVRIWSVIGLIAMLIAIRFPGIDWVVRQIPGLKVAQNQRLLFTTAFALALLAGFGLQELLDRLASGASCARLSQSLRWLAIGLAVMALAGVLTFWLAKDRIIRQGDAMIQARYDTGHHGGGREFPKSHWLNEVRLIQEELMLISLRLLIPAFIFGTAAWLLSHHDRKADGVPDPNHPPAYRGMAQSALVTANPVPWLVLSLADLLCFAILWNPAVPVQTNYPKTPATEFLRQRQLAEFCHFGGTYRTLIPETSCVYHLDDVRGYDAVGSVRMFQWTRAVDKTPEYQAEYLNHLYHPNEPAWELLGMRYLITAPDQPPPGGPWRQVYPPDGQSVTDAFIYENPNGLPHAWVVGRVELCGWPDDVLARIANASWDFDPRKVALVDDHVHSQDKPLLQAALTQHPDFFGQHGASAAKVTFLDPADKREYNPEHLGLHVSGGGGGWLITADAYFPGWSARIINHDTGLTTETLIVPAFGTMRAVALPDAANLDVVFDYHPRSWRWGIRISGAALAVLALISGIGLAPISWCCTRCGRGN